MQPLAIERTGKGFPLVLIHGYLAGAEIWRRQIDCFKKRFDVLAFNLPGFGGSAQHEMPPSITEIASMIMEQLSSLGVRHFHLMGHSMGGMIVQAMAAIAPERISHLVCYGTGPVGVLPNRFETIDESRKRLLTDGLEPTVRRIAATWFLNGGKDPSYPVCVELGMKANMQAALASLTAWENWDGRSELANISSRTLIVWGDRDRSYGWSQPEALWRGITDSSLAVVPDCAHNVHMEKPDFFNYIIGDFLPATV